MASASREMDGVSTVRIGQIGLNEQRDGSYWAKLGPIEMTVTMFAEATPAQPARAATDEMPAAPALPATPRLFYALIEDDEEGIASGQGESAQDAAMAATAELTERLGALAEILGVSLDGEA